MRTWQCYLRIALRARSASGLLDALGLGYDLPVGQAVYAIDAFPDDDLLWRIEWIGGVGYNTSVPSEPQIDVCLAQLPNGALFEWHEVEHEGCRFGNAIRQADAGTIIGSKYPFLVLGQRRCFDAFMKRVGVDLGDVDREPFFQFCAGRDGTAFRIVIALLFDIGKCCTFEPTSPG